MHVATDQSAASEINLVCAASESLCTARFISSNLGVPITDPCIVQIPQLSLCLLLKSAIETFSCRMHRATTIKELSRTRLEYTRFFVGVIANNLGLPYLRSHMY